MHKHAFQWQFLALLFLTLLLSKQNWYYAVLVSEMHNLSPFQ